MSTRPGHQETSRHEQLADSGLVGQVEGNPLDHVYRKHELHSSSSVLVSPCPALELARLAHWHTDVRMSRAIVWFGSQVVDYCKVAESWAGFGGEVEAYHGVMRCGMTSLLDLFWVPLSREARVAQATANVWRSERIMTDQFQGDHPDAAVGGPQVPTATTMLRGPTSNDLSAVALDLCCDKGSAVVLSTTRPLASPACNM